MTLDRPAWRTRPQSCSSAKAPKGFANGTAVSGRWSWYMLMARPEGSWCQPRQFIARASVWRSVGVADGAACACGREYYREVDWAAS